MALYRAYKKAILHDSDIEKGNTKMSAFMIQMQVIYTALMAGMMLMYTITLGRYFDYILKTQDTWRISKLGTVS